MTRKQVVSQFFKAFFDHLCVNPVCPLTGYTRRKRGSALDSRVRGNDILKRAVSREHDPPWFTRRPEGEKADYSFGKVKIPVLYQKNINHG